MTILFPFHLSCSWKDISMRIKYRVAADPNTIIIATHKHTPLLISKFKRFVLVCLHHAYTNTGILKILPIST